MNGKDIFLGLKHIGTDLIQEAEFGSFSTQAEETESKNRRSFRRPLLIAAVIALSVLLVGCAVVYALRLQDMSVGKETYTQTFDDQGKYLEEPVEKTRDILTLFGHSGDNIQKATAEWFAFLDTYDPNGDLMDNNPDHTEIPNQYEYTYGCYTQDMIDKVDEIAAKYDLKLLEEWLPFQRYQTDIFFEETEIGSFVLPGSGAEISSISGMFYPPYNVDVDFELSLEGVRGKLWVTALYARKDYFPVDYPGGTDLSLYEQWDHTAPDGTHLLLALNKKGGGYIIAEPENAMLIYSIDGNFSRSNYPTAEEVMTQAELELVADAFDYSIQPEVLDRDGVWEKLEASNKAHEAENVYAPETYGSFAEYLTKMFTLPSEELQYTFYDLTGDGEKELLVGSNGAYRYWVTLRNGETLERLVMATYLCENGVEERYSVVDHYETHMYIKPVSESVIDDIGAEKSIITVLRREKDQWSQGLSDYEQTPITKEEAQAIMEQYARVELDWKQLMEYPISETQTLGDYIVEKDVRVSGEELLEIYKNKLNGMKDMYYSHYRILDINADGVDDLLLKGEASPHIGNTEFYWSAMTYRYGRMVTLASDFYLCEDGVLETVGTRSDVAPGVEINGHKFLRCTELKKEELDFVAYNKATASWQGDWYGDIVITEAEANTILAKYPRINQGMRPISELLD